MKQWQLILILIPFEIFSMLIGAAMLGAWQLRLRRKHDDK